jgi:hypothetical protein
VVAVDSDTDLDGGGYEVDVAADDESASQVVLVDSDEAAAVLTEADQEEDAAQGLAGVSRQYDDDDLPVRAVAAPPAPWPGWVVAPLALSLLFAFLGGLMSFESLRGMWGYNKPANALVRGMADTLGMKVTD